ncbi:OmpA family protein [Aquimarina sp. LLG6339-5]|uniref:OmpA family protein n=1 Tax=Aquimarina sp. LLG6339-5 TaxID=3160830 RepID=UPI003866FF7D
MIKKILVSFILLISLCCSHTMNAQRKVLNIANKQFEEKQYVSAQETYKKVLKSNFKSPDVLKKLGDSYYFNSQLIEAEVWYSQLKIEYPDDVTEEYLFRYAQCLRSIEDYDKADQVIDEYYQRTQGYALQSESLRDDNYLKRIEYQSGRYEINNQNINSPFTDFGSAVYGDSIVFSSSRDTLLIKKRIHKWTDESFLSLYIASKDTETGDLINVKPFAKELNTKFHESTPVFSADENTMYFTQNKIGENKKELDILGIYRSSKTTSGSWSFPKELSINEKNFSVAHPSLDSDRNVLYFSSDKQGGYGDSDIYGVSIDNEGNLGIPYNLGPQINTPGKETFPFISKDNELYFSSNGHSGLGGLDVYYVDLNKEILEIINVGRAINGNRDDFAFVIDNDSKKGYFSSNREGGKGKDDIYSLTELIPIRSFDINMIKGTVLDTETKNPVIGSVVSIYDQKNNLIEQQTILEDGEYNFSSEQLKNVYVIRAEKDGYNIYEHIIEKIGYQDVYYKAIELEKDYDSFSDLSANFSELKDTYKFELIVDPTHFSNSKEQLSSSSKRKLDKISELLRKYTKIAVEIKAYTKDNNDFSNLASDRAEVIKKYIIDQGIDSNRLLAQGVPRGSVKLEKRFQLMMVVPMPIEFNLNSEDLRQDAEIGLNKVVDLMKIYPSMKMEVHGHADSRSSFWYNKRLSVRRMRAAMNYITNQGGIYWKRLRGKAYGERKLYNECTDDVPCSEEMHEKNRRCEFIVKE